MAFMAVGDYMIACTEKQLERLGSKPTKPSPTQHTSGQKSVFTKSHDPNNFSITK